MKNATPLAALLLLIAFVFSHCAPDRNLLGTTKEIISEGRWTVDYYYQGSDKTAQLSTFQFAFNPNGTVACQQDTALYPGTWSMVHDVNRNDVLRIQINCQDPSLHNLNTEWQVTAKGMSLLSMKDAGASQLRFRRL